MSIRSRLIRLHNWLVPVESGQGWVVYLWLVYLAFFFIEWLFRPVSTLEIGLTAASMAVFLGLYFSAWRRSGIGTLAHIAAITALGAAWTPFNAGASVLFIFASSFAFRVGPPRQALAVVLSIAALAGLLVWWTQPVLYYWLPGVFVSLIVGIVNIYFGERERQNAELRLSQAEVRRLARIAERERIARDLHDVLGHTLSLITVKSELAARLVERDPDRARDELESIEASARSALSEVRQAISGFNEQTLQEALEQARLTLLAADVELEIEHDEGLDVPSNQQAMLALVIREAITNVIRHADARRCRIRLVSDNDGGLRMQITDDGRGDAQCAGSGVQGMRARVESLGGEFDISNDGGVKIVARIPTAASQ